MEASPHKAQGHSPLVQRSHRPRCPWWKGLEPTRLAWVTTPPPRHRERQTLLLPVTSPLTVLTAAHHGLSELGARGGLGTAWAPDDLAVWLTLHA